MIGIVPILVARPLRAVIDQWSRGLGTVPSLEALAPLSALTWLALVLLGTLSVGFLAIQAASRLGHQRRSVTWDCGYALPSSRMQYTASSFASLLVELFRSVLRPRWHEPKIVTPFPSATRFESHVDDVVLDGILIPLWKCFRSCLGWLRVLQHGSIQTYILYILIAFLMLLSLTTPWAQILRAIVGAETP
jgi:hydrogenase-4 component B